MHAPLHFNLDAVVAREPARESGADELLMALLGNAVCGAEGIEEMGLRAWIMCARLSAESCPMPRAADKKRMREAAIVCGGRLGLPAANPEVKGDVARMVMGHCVTAWAIGRRVSLLAYAFCPHDEVLAVLRSFEHIGVLWRLRADNKRSAVCAAMKKLKEDIFRHRAWRVGLWFEKRETTVRKYEAAQIGNTNRRDGEQRAEDDDKPELAQAREEIAVIVSGVRVKPQYARMSALELREHLRRQRELAEWMAANPQLGCRSLAEAEVVKRRMESGGMDRMDCSPRGAVSASNPESDSVSPIG